MNRMFSRLKRLLFQNPALFFSSITLVFKLELSKENYSGAKNHPWNIVATVAFSCHSRLINYQKNRQHQSPLCFRDAAADVLDAHLRSDQSRWTLRKPFNALSFPLFSPPSLLSTSPLEAHRPSPADKTVDKPLWCPDSFCSSPLQSLGADALGPKTNTQIMGPCWGRLNVSNVMQMWREEGRNGEERSRAEVEAVGVFVCPRRPLSSHYQGIRQMLLLYRCWFDSEPPTLIPSSLLLLTTPRQRLLYAFSPPLHIATHQQYHLLKIFTQLSKFTFSTVSSCFPVMH